MNSQLCNSPFIVMLFSLLRKAMNASLDFSTGHIALTTSDIPQSHFLPAQSAEPAAMPVPDPLCAHRYDTVPEVSATFPVFHDDEFLPVCTAF